MSFEWSIKIICEKIRKKIGIDVDARANPQRAVRERVAAATKAFYHHASRLMCRSLSTSNIEVEAQIITKELFDEEESESNNKTYQVHQKYILSVVKSGIICINQNLAHQRVLYEDLLTHEEICFRIVFINRSFKRF